MLVDAEKFAIFLESFKNLSNFMKFTNLKMCLDMKTVFVILLLQTQIQNYLFLFYNNYLLVIWQNK